jgi:hypothetical protein
MFFQNWNETIGTKAKAIVEGRQLTQEKSKRPSPGGETADENDPFGAESLGLRSKLIPPL